VLVMIKSGPDTAEATVGLDLAREGGADLVLLQNGVYLARAGALGEWAGAVYLLEDDKRLRGLKDADLDTRARTIGYDALTDLVVGADAVLGMF
jgi:sulfur relay protein TusB/DsrH